MPSQLKLIIWGVSSVIILILILILSPFTIVGAGERAVITNLGKVDRVLEPGMHWVTPITESVHTFDVQTQKETVDASSASKDLQDVNASIAITYNINPEALSDLYTNIGNDYSRKIIDPSLQEGIKAATAKYTAEELITKRETVTKDILSNVKAGVVERAGGDYITVTSIAITNFSFSASFNQSIEAKVKAEQDALTAKNKLAQVKYEAEQTVASAQAQAESIKIQAQAINSQGGADYVNLKAIEKWNGVLPAQMIPGGTVPFINIKAQ